MMSRIRQKQTPISVPRVLLVEGQDEKYLFSGHLRRMELGAEVQVIEMRGKGNQGTAVSNLLKDPGRGQLRSIGIVLDADRDADGAFQCACSVLRGSGLPQPELPLERVGENPSCGVMVLPVDSQSGKLEDVCLKSVEDDPAMPCVDQYFQCLRDRLQEFPRDEPKARVRAFLVCREVLEESHFDFVRDNLQAWLPTIPNPPSVEKVHAFLASRYNPRLDLGRAAEPDPSYWNFDHPVFEPIKEFLRNL